MSKYSTWSHVSTPATTSKLDELICDEHGGSIAWAYKKENALLIAQAPRLLEALIMVRDADNDCIKDGLPSIPIAARAEIDAAIEATKGNDND